jgi:protein gp37
MSEQSGIGWTEATWVIVEGCDPVSPGCANCFAVLVVHRLSRNPNPRVSGPLAGLVERRNGVPRWTGKVVCRHDRLEEPLRWKRPRLIFVPSLGDVFHPAVPDDFLAAVWRTMARADWHTFQVLTKHPDRMADFLRGREALPNVWLGASVERQREAEERLPLLVATPAVVRFASCEPLLGPLDLSPWLGSDRLSWVIVGGESGPRRRPMELAWLASVARQCQAAGVPVFVKQDTALRGGQQGRIPGDLWELKQLPVVVGEPAGMTGEGR